MEGKKKDFYFHFSLLLTHKLNKEMGIVQLVDGCMLMNHDKQVESPTRVLV